MRFAAGAVVAAGIAFAGPAQAEWTEAMATELQALVAAFQEGEDVDTNRIVALSDAARESGTIPFGIFEGTLTPLEGAIELKGIQNSELVCQTTEDSSISRPTVYTDTITIARPGDGTTRLDYLSVDSVSRLALSALHDGVVLELEEMTFTDQYGPLRLTPTPDGGFDDSVTGDHYGPENADVQALNAMIDAIVLANPSWFISEADVELGDPWLVAGGEDNLTEALMGLVSGALPGGGRVEVGFLHSAVTGLTDVRGAPAVVLEYLLDVDIVDAVDAPPMNLRIVTAEIYEIERFVRLGYNTDARVQMVEEIQTTSQVQDCFLRNG